MVREASVVVTTVRDKHMPGKNPRNNFFLLLANTPGEMFYS